MTLQRLQRLRRVADHLFLAALLLGSLAAGGFLAYGYQALRAPVQTVPFFGGHPEAPPPSLSPFDDPILVALLGVALLCLAAGRILLHHLRHVRRPLGGGGRRP